MKKWSTKNKKTICIIGAMECEVEKLRQKLENSSIANSAKLVIYTGQLCGHNVILSQSGVGKVNAAINTQYIIDKYEPDIIINTGIAGGLDCSLSVSDIIIGTELVQHDFDVTAIGYARGYMCTGINPDKPTIFYSDKELIEKYEYAVKTCVPQTKVHRGIIASGDAFISDNKKKKEIREQFSASAVEMEGAAIAQTAAKNDIPFIIVRAISDLADDNAAKDHEFVETEMAELSALSVEKFIENLD